METLMKKTECIELQILSPKSLLNKEDMLRMVRLQCELLPQYLPQKWYWQASQKYLFDPLHPEAIIHGTGNTETTFWKRIGRDRARGSWMTRWANREANQTHGYNRLNVYSTKYQAALLHYFKRGSLDVLADLSYLEAFTENYKDIAYQNKFGPNKSMLFLTTHILRHWLPDMTWATVFGAPYVKLFGKERLLSTPAYCVEELGPETVFIQLTPSLNDLFDKFDEVMAAREAAKRHLGYECFYQPDLEYDWREEPEKAGKIFRVPEFHLLDDNHCR
jgi:hypothetical protein